MIPGKLKVGDTVFVRTGGNSRKGKTLKGRTGKILSYNAKNQRVTVEGLNMVRRHQRAKTSADTPGIVDKEGSIHVSNVSFFDEKSGKPVRLKAKSLGDGRKVRGFTNPETGDFEQLEN